MEKLFSVVEKSVIEFFTQPSPQPLPQNGRGVGGKGSLKQDRWSLPPSIGMINLVIVLPARLWVFAKRKFKLQDLTLLFRVYLKWISARALCFLFIFLSAYVEAGWKYDHVDDPEGADYYRSLYDGISAASLQSACNSAFEINPLYGDDLWIFAEVKLTDASTGMCFFNYDGSHALTVTFVLSSCPSGAYLDGNGQCLCTLPQVLNGSGTACITPNLTNNGINFGSPAANPGISPPTTPPSENIPSSDTDLEATDGGHHRDSCNSPNSSEVADPINVAIGNVYETIVDYTGQAGGGLPLRIERSYNSLNGTKGIFGYGWTSNLDMQMNLSIQGNSLSVRLPNGQVAPFTLNAGAWVPASTLPLTLVANSGGYLLTTYDKHRYQFDSSGHLVKQTNAQGEQQSYQYNASNQLISVTDNYGNVLSLNYSNALVSSISVAGQTFQYGYTTTVIGDFAIAKLASVTYPSNVTRQYLYENASFPYALTGLIDETGKRISTWGYNTQGLANTNNRAGSENFTIDYTHIADSPDPYSLVTNAKGHAWKYHLQTGSDGIVHVISVEGLGTANCAAASNYTSYDSGGHAITVTDGNGNVTLRHYTANGLVDQETVGYQWNGGVNTGNTIDLVETSTMRKQIVTAWDATNTWPTTLMYSGKDLSGTWLQYQQEDRVYDTHGRPQSKTLTDLTNFTDPYNSHNQTRSWTYAYTYYDSAQTKVHTLSVQGPDGNSLSTYDTQGHLTQVSRIVSASLSLNTGYSNFNAAGLPQRITDPNGVPTQLNYDPRNRLHQVIRNVGDSSAQTTTIDYYDNGLLKQVTLNDGSWLKYTYSDGVHLNRLDDNAGNYVLLTPSVLNGQWTQRKVFDGSGTLQQTQNRVFDDLGRLAQMLDSSNAVTKSSYSYDLGSNLASSKVGTDATTAIVRNYDALNRLKQLNTPDGNNSQYRYDAQGNLAKVTDPRGIVTQYFYDGLGNLMKLQSPDSGVTKFWYNTSGNVAKKIDARNIETDYHYDALNRITQIDMPDDEYIFTYDFNYFDNYELGRLSFVQNLEGYIIFSHDALGNVVAKADWLNDFSFTAETDYYYDNANRVIQMVYPSGRIVTYTRNSLGQITQVQTQDDGNSPLQTIVSNVTYKPFGPLKGLTFGNGINTTIQYDQDYRVSRITAASNPNWDFVYGYDAANNINQLIDQAASATFSKLYTYDNLNRLIVDNRPSAGGIGNYQYQYDANSNRTQVKIANSNLFTTNQTYASTSNRETQYGSTAMGYDNAGNLTTYGEKTYSYNAANRLSQFTSGNLVATYRYNPFGQRLTKQTSSGKTHYDYLLDGKYIDVLQLNNDGTHNQLTEYIWLDDTPIAQIKTTYGANNVVTNKRLTYIHSDHLNTPRAMTDSTKTIVWRWDNTTAYGSISPNNNPDGDNITDTLDLRFPGQIADSEMGLYCSMFRCYDPVMGRFTQSDLIGPTRNYSDPVLQVAIKNGLLTINNSEVARQSQLNHPYAYVLNNPISYIDPSGLIGIGNTSSPMGGHKGGGPGPGPSIGDALSGPNGNMWGQPGPQDWVCTLPNPIPTPWGPQGLGTLGDAVFPARCVRHDQCYQDNQCTASSWCSSLLGGTKSCNKCNSGFFK